VDSKLKIHQNFLLEVGWKIPTPPTQGMGNPQNYAELQNGTRFQLFPSVLQTKISTTTLEKDGNMRYENPYLKGKDSPTFVLAKTGEPIAGNRNFNASGRISMFPKAEPIVASNGDVNASSDKDLLGQIKRLVTAAGNREVKPLYEQAKAFAQDHAELIEAAKADKNGPAFQALGQSIGDEVWITENRQGFARKVLLVKPMGKGEEGKFRIRKKDVMAFMATGPSEAIASRVRQDWIYPKEFKLQARVYIDIIQLRQDTGDLLEDKYVDALEQIMVQEDILLKRLSDRAAQVRNDLIVFNNLSPQVWTSMRTQIGSWNITPATAIISFDLWDDIIADPTFSAWYSPVEKHQLILEGKIGSLLNIDIITDGYRYDTLRVLNPGEMYMYGTPQTVGGICQGQELIAEPINAYNLGRAETGWFMVQTEGMAIANSLAVTRGQRV
jgi:hypothetical protein